MKKQTLVDFNKDWSEAVFEQHDALDIIDFIHYASTYLNGASESLFENITQCASEIALYGDSGPGTMLRLGEQIAAFNKVADRYTDLTGAEVQRPRLPSYPVSNDYDYDDYDQRY